MPDSKIPGDWEAEALDDLDTAMRLEGIEEKSKHIAVHCQQAAEYHIKAWLLKVAGYSTRGHDLTYLLELAIQFGCPLEGLEDECAFLTPFYTCRRYPQTGMDRITYAEAQEALEAAKRILARRWETDSGVGQMKLF